MQAQVTILDEPADEKKESLEVTGPASIKELNIRRIPS
jgi:hypothetical protein